MAKVAKVPVVMQMEDLECGAACLCMILAYYGKWLSLEQVRSDCGVCRDGCNAKDILKSARNYGFKAAGYRMETAELRGISFPAIIHWNFNHFVVLDGFKKDKAVLNDPALGVVQVSASEFDKAFTGIVLKFEKTKSFVPEGKPKSVWSFAKKYLSNTFSAFAFILLTSILTAGISIIIPTFYKVFIDNILSGKNTEWLKPFVIAIIITIIFQFIISVIRSIYWLKIRGMLAIKANASFMWHVLRLPVEFFSQRSAGEIVFRQSSNENIAETLIIKLAPIFMNILMLVIYLIIMFRYSIILSIVGIAAMFINMLFLRTISKKRVNMSRVMERNGGKLSGITMSGFEMIETIKSSGAENGFFERWAGYFTKEENAQIKFSKANYFYNAIPQLLQQLADITVLMIGVYLILDGVFTIGMLVAFQAILSSFLSPVNELIGVEQSFIEMRTQMELVEDVMNCKPDVEYNKDLTMENEQFEKLSGQIEMSNINFGYNKLLPPLIENFSLNLKSGQSVALVGGSGSGKSTLEKLISGLYQPWSGDILFNGLKKNEISHNVFTGSIAVVDQDIVLFEDTIMNNITMWDKSISEADVIASCKDAQIHEDIMLRPGGYLYNVKENGKNFSGGQRQRFEIARALSIGPTIIILDEATSALDSKTEQLVMEAIKARGITMIIIAHRLSTVRDCDEIIVLDKGKVVERGSHDELMKINGEYASLVSN